MSEDSAPQFYTKQQVAEKLQLTERAVARLILKGQVKCVRLGGRVRISSVELERLARGAG